MNRKKLYWGVALIIWLACATVGWMVWNYNTLGERVFDQMERR